MKNAWIENIRRVQDIGKEIAKLREESTRLRKIIATTATHNGYHEPMHDDPVEFLIGTPDPAEAVMVTIFPNHPEKPAKDWNILYRKIPVHTYFVKS